MAEYGAFGITPARAGKSGCAFPENAAAGDHPRSRGEKPVRQLVSPIARGSPPLARGKAYGRIQAIGTKGITPARAGKRKRSMRNWRSRRDHPRSRGEKTMIEHIITVGLGSPPLARGKVYANGWPTWTIGITPARAGKSFQALSHPNRRRDHPRSRGEKDYLQLLKTKRRGSPPLARGKAAPATFYKTEFGITPARAGKSRMRAAAPSGRWDHPRSRGEKQRSSDWKAAHLGSPPLARGKDELIAGGKQQLGITPARAGKRLKTP